MPPPPSYILATAGHVDHGKTALVRALTGVDTDRLPEEKARGITIDLGFAGLDLPTPAGGVGVGVHLGVVDVPGHEDFVRNMVAGIGSIDLALLVVAADDGWMPQTEEHVQILGYQGVCRGVVAVTKIDLAIDENATIAEVRRRLAGCCLAEAAIVPTSVVTGRGIDALRAALVDEIAHTPLPRDIGKPRLPIDRVFTVKGIGTVVTGTLTGGSLSRGQAVVARPGTAAGKARSVQRHNRDAAQVPPGSRVAVNVPELAGAARGVVVTGPKFADVTDTLDVVVERSARTDPRPLPHAARVWVHHGTAAVPGRLYRLDRDAPALAQLRLESPVCAWLGDRLVIRDWPQQHTLAGGVVLDLAPARRAYNADRRRAALDCRRHLRRDDAAGWVAAEADDRGTVLRATVLAQSWFAAAEVESGITAALADGRAVAAGAYLVGRARWTRWIDRAVAAVDAEHTARPEHVGIAIAEVRAALGDVPDPTVSDAVVAALVANGFRRTGATLARAGHRAALPAHLVDAGARVRAVLAERPLEPPNRYEVGRVAADRAALQFLLDTGEAVVVGDELVLLADAVDRAGVRVREHIAAAGPASASDLRQVLGTTRRVVMPLLELLDRRGVTRRVGDLRHVRR